MGKPEPQGSRWLPWRGMLLYLVVGVSWVFVGDWLLAQWVQDPQRLTTLQTWKGWTYVLLTSGLAGWMLHQMRRSEQTRLATAQELYQVVRHAPAGIARVAEDGRLLWANERLCEMLGIDEARARTLNFRDLVRAPDQDEDWVSRELARLFGGLVDHHVGECEFVRPDDGSVLPVLCTVTLVAAAGNQNPAHAVCVLQDLREMQAARSAMAASDARERLASAVVDNTVEGVVVTDAHSRILSVNAAVTRMLGYTEAELLGKTPRVFKSGRHDAAFYEAMWAAMRETGHWQGEIWNRRKNGEVFPEYMSLSAVRNPMGEITHYVCMFTDISQEKAQQQRMEFLALHDALTGLSNRAGFTRQLEQAVQDASATGERMAVLLINLDRFKDVNDSYGHAIGDQVLQHIARQVQAAARPGDIVGRLAGDELAVLVRQVRHHEGAEAVARHLIRSVAEPWRSPDGLEVVAGASIGICLYPEHAAQPQALLQGAHAAVYGAKAQGRGAWCFFHEAMTQAARERLALESRLRTAITQGHLRLYYQPQVDMASGRIVGAEALVRWQDPDEGLIPPARFIPVAETSGVIGPLGEWVVREACRQGQQWRAAGLPALTMAVNVSPRQFHLTDLAGATAAALADTGFPPAQLELEITETALAERTDDARTTLLRLRALGVRLAIDDFGTGYSSLGQLKQLPIDVLKIDRGFIQDLPASADDLAISSAVIALGHSLGLNVLAEGVETEAQLACLRERGCDHYQGYLCSRPLPADAFEALLRERGGPGTPSAPPTHPSPSATA